MDQQLFWWLQSHTRDFGVHLFDTVLPFGIVSPPLQVQPHLFPSRVSISSCLPGVPPPTHTHFLSQACYLSLISSLSYTRSLTPAIQTNVLLVLASIHHYSVPPSLALCCHLHPLTLQPPLPPPHRLSNSLVFLPEGKGGM